MHVKIGQLARLTDCKVVTIRYYEKEGLLKAPSRSDGNYRLYDEDDIERLKFVRHCRQHDMTLAEIRELLAYMDNPSSSCAWINDLIERHIEKIDRQIQDLNHLKGHLVLLNRNCDGQKRDECGILKGLLKGMNCSHCQRNGREDDKISGGLSSHN